MGYQWTLSEASVYFGPLKALYFKNVNRMGLSTNPLICNFIIFKILLYHNYGALDMSTKSFTLTLENNKTEDEAIQYLLDSEPRFYLPNLEQRKAILSHLEIDIKYLKAFDLLLLQKPAVISSELSEKELRNTEIIEIKSSKKYLPKNPRGFFFGATENEFQLVKKVEAKKHKMRFCFVCLNKKSKSYKLLNVGEIENLIQSKRVQYQIHFKK